MFKKALFLAVFSVLAYGSIASAATPCQPGDKFNILTGQLCPVITTSTDPKDVLISQLRAQVVSLQAQLDALNGQSVSSVISEKERKLREVDAQILPLLSNVNTSDFEYYLNQVNTVLGYYKIIDPETKFGTLTRSSGGYFNFEKKALDLKKRIEDYIKYRTF